MGHTVRSTIAVESAIWNGNCGKCSCAAVHGMATVTSVPVLQFKMRCIFLFTVVCSIRKKYSFLFFPFCQSFSLEAPYILHALPNQTVFDFLPQRHNKLCHSISDIMDYFLAVEDQQQTNQHNDLVGGKP